VAGKTGLNHRQLKIVAATVFFYAFRPAKMSKCPVFARTGRKMAAQMGKSAHGQKAGPHGTDFRRTGSENGRTEREMARTGRVFVPQIGKCPHGI
jgi:hypothetical protein